MNLQRYGASHLVKGVLLSALVAVLVPSVSEARLGRPCGTARWSIKTLADSDARFIDPSPINTTVSTLADIDPTVGKRNRKRRIRPYELREYRVTAIVGEITREADHDWHLVLVDPDTRASIVGEIPAPECVSDANLAARFTEARRAMRSVPKHGLVIITGVGFFDFAHGTRGRAANNFELHPVVRVERAR